MTRKPAPASTLMRTVPLLLGIAGLGLAVTMGALNGHFLAWHFAMGALSLASIAGSLLWLGEVRLRDFLASSVYTVFFILCCATVYLLSANRHQRFDLTTDARHTLTGQTISILNRFPGDHLIRMELFLPAKDHFAAEKYLETYRSQNGRFVYQLYDPRRDLDVAAKLGTIPKEGLFYLTVFNAMGEPIRRTDGTLDLASPLREHTLTNALARVVSDQQETIYWSAGLGEKRVDGTADSLTQLAEAIAAGAVDVKEFRLMEGRIPQDISVLVIAGPQRDLSDFDLELLRNYLDEGGKLFLLLDPMFEQRIPMPNFDALLNHLGLEMPNAFVIDPLSVSATRVTTTPQAIWVRHPISLATNRVPFLLDRARPIRSFGAADPLRKLEGILVTSEQCWAEDVNAIRSFRRPTPPDDPEEIGVQILAVSVTRETPGGRFGREMRVVLIGDSEAFTDRQLAANGDAAAFFTQSVNWLREREDLLQIPPRFLTATPVSINRTTFWTMLGAFMLAGLVITVGGTTWAMARRRMR